MQFRIVRELAFWLASRATFNFARDSCEVAFRLAKAMAPFITMSLLSADSFCQQIVPITKVRLRFYRIDMNASSGPIGTMPLGFKLRWL
jgi:hypothetical protein